MARRTKMKDRQGAVDKMQDRVNKATRQSNEARHKNKMDEIKKNIMIFVIVSLVLIVIVKSL